jgi:hypothetical protein
MPLPPTEQGFRRYLYDQGGQTEAIDLLPHQYEEGIELPPQLSGLTLWSEDGMDQFEAPSAPWGSGYMPMQEPLPTVGHNYAFDAANNPIYGWTGPRTGEWVGTAYTAPPLHNSPGEWSGLLRQGRPVDLLPANQAPLPGEWSESYRAGHPGHGDDVWANMSPDQKLIAMSDKYAFSDKFSGINKRIHKMDEENSPQRARQSASPAWLNQVMPLPVTTDYGAPTQSEAAADAIEDEQFNLHRDLQSPALF